MRFYIFKHFSFTCHAVGIENNVNNQEPVECSNDKKIDVIIVDSMEKDYAKRKKQILVKPECNPYYEKENYEEHENSQAISLENSIDKIKAINNIYYE